MKINDWGLDEDLRKFHEVLITGLSQNARFKFKTKKENSAIDENCTPKFFLNLLFYALNYTKCSVKFEKLNVNCVILCKLKFDLKKKN